MVDQDRVADLLVAAEGYLADVRRFRDEVGHDRFLADHAEQYRILFPLQQALQAGIDLAARLLADSPGRRPETLAGMFAALADRDLIGPDLAVRLGAMARFRNLLVHQYGEVDAVRVWEIISDHLGDLDAFLRIVATHIDSD